MMVLGLEEPLHPNKQIFALNEPAGEIEQSRVADDGLNRYSFIWTGPFDQRDERLTRLLHHLHEVLGEEACWFLVWPTIPGQDAGDHPHILRRRQEGWEVQAGETITVAQQVVDWDSLRSSGPAGYERLPGDAGLFLVFGDTPPAPDYTRPPIRASLEDFARRREFNPSSPALSWFRERGLTLVYSQRDLHSRLGRVVVSPHRLDRDRLEQSGLADAVHAQDEASLAWRYIKK